MKLLILTQKVDKNDDVLGFFHGWIAEFAKHFEQVTIIALGVGEYDLPQNVRVFSLGKEKHLRDAEKDHPLRERTDLGNFKRSVLEEQPWKIKYVIRFYHLIWRERNNYDTVFVHMNPVYVVLGAPLWHIWKKKVALWYTHRHVDWTLHVARKCADNIFTATAASFRIQSPKLKILGHGIFTEDFMRPDGYVRDIKEKITIISVGRLTPIKNLDVLIHAVAILRDQRVDCAVLLVGSTATSTDKNYLEYLQELVKEKKLDDMVHFVGSIPNKEVMHYYWKSDISINLAPTGGIDKAVLESMASGVPVIVANKAFEEYFGEYKDDLICKEGDAKDLSIKIRALLERKDQQELIAFLTRTVKEKGSAQKLIQQIVKHIS